jgi:hypothetical protein
MSPELEKKLVDKYPQLFADTDKPPTKSLMCFGCECGDGWFNLIDAACKLISAYLKSQKTPHVLATFKWSQIKEKYGTLRLYGTSVDDYIAGIIDMAETLSGRVCEICGCPGKICGTGWLTTRCESCAP